MTVNKTPDNKIPLFLPHSSTSTDLNKTGSWRYVQPVFDEKTSPCSAACPLGEDIARIEMLVSQEKIHEAGETILAENPFPAVCGRVCFHHCENSCNRGHFDEAVAIHHLERFVGDALIDRAQSLQIKKMPDNGKKVAIAGSGPAGLGAAYFLSKLGYQCDVFESGPEPGGILRWGIPTYRLSLAVLEDEIRRIKKLGVAMHCRTTVTPELMASIQSRHDALFIACGLGRAIDLKIKGAQKTINGLQFLYQIRAGQNVSLNVKGKAAVIGGGNTAIDVARTLVRLGMDTIIVYRRRQQDMPAFAPEINMALDEGVEIKPLLSPIAIEDAGRRSKVGPGRYAITLQKMKTGAIQKDARARVIPDGDKTETFQVDHVFAALGAEPAASWQTIPVGREPSLVLSHCRLIRDRIPIAYGGDLTNGVKSVADAIASGKQAAIALDTCFKSGWDDVNAAVAECRVGPGPAVSMAMYSGMARKNRNLHVVSSGEINTHYFKTARRTNAVELSPNDRRRTFSSVVVTLKKKEALEESRRCFNCGICNACDYCRLWCPEMSVIVEGASREIDLDYCKGCGLCVAECPRNAMALKEENT